MWGVSLLLNFIQLSQSLGDAMVQILPIASFTFSMQYQNQIIKILHGKKNTEVKNIFYFILKAPFILKIFHFFYFSPSFPHFPDSKEQMEVG